jgi:hypothetical protein
MTSCPVRTRVVNASVVRARASAACGDVGPIGSEAVPAQVRASAIDGIGLVNAASRNIDIGQSGAGDARFSARTKTLWSLTGSVAAFS